MKRILFLLTVVCSLQVSAQYSIGGGFSTFNSTNSGITRVGLHLFYENPHNEVTSFYLRSLFTLPVKRFDSLSLALVGFEPGLPAFASVGREIKTTYIAVDGGTRRYIFNTYDSGFAVFGHLHLKGVLARYSEEVDDYNEELYQPNDPVFPDGLALLLGIGADIGFKWQLPSTGSFLFEAGFDAFQRLSDPIFILGNEIGTLGLTFNISYRHDIF
jgi:hypothetical protein